MFCLHTYRSGMKIWIRGEFGYTYKWGTSSYNGHWIRLCSLHWAYIICVFLSICIFCWLSKFFTKDILRKQNVYPKGFFTCKDSITTSLLNVHTHIHTYTVNFVLYIEVCVCVTDQTYVYWKHASVQQKHNTSDMDIFT